MMETHEAAKLARCPDENCSHRNHVIDGEAVYSADEQDELDGGEFMKVVDVRCEKSGNEAQVVWVGKNGLDPGRNAVGVRGDMELVDSINTFNRIDQ